MALEILYALFAGLSTLLGGILLLYTHLKKVNIRYLTAFAAGIIIATAFFEMIPEIKEGASLAVIGLGFFVIYLLEKIILIHACKEEECTYQYHNVSWLSLFGLTIDNFVDGAAIAAGFLISPLLGLTITIAVFTHELAQGLSTAIIMRPVYKTRSIILALIIAAILTPAGAYASRFFPELVFKNVLAFAAGIFLYIGASDLLPEAHEKFNWKIVLSVVIGALFIIVTGMFFE
ncbi:ZIP family metal transporter [Candidatus Woesearchaeota archaeon]|nr:ZIP family metal transporter [Candidatus Woesearchaeota archaeon]